MTELKLTPEQERVLEYTKMWPMKRSMLRDNPVPPIMIEALAGSGKTTIMVEFAKQLPSYCDIVAVAFNKLIANELAVKMPEDVNCRTFSSLGYQIWKGRTGLSKLNMVKWKTGDIAKKNLKLGFLKNCFPDLQRIIGLAKASGVEPCGVMERPETYFCESTDAFWSFLADQNDLVLGKKGGMTKEEALGVCRDVIRISCEQALEGFIDFDDMLYMPALYGGPFPTPDVVIVDEFQDVSSIQNALIHRMLAKRGTLVGVGDRFQSIYAFRGADSEAIPRGIGEFGCSQLPLTVTFRCGKAIAEEARKEVPMLQTLPEQHEGEVVRPTKWDAKSVQVGDAILCRNNAPLVDICLNLIAKRVPAKILGQDIGAGLKKMLDDLDTDNLLVLPDRLKVYKQAKMEGYLAKGMNGLAARLDDRCKALNYILSSFDPTTDTVSDVKRLITSMFSDTTPQVTLCSVHKSKGREWDRVFFLDDWLVPSRFAKSPQALQQEKNIWYVAVTRARNSLIYVDSKDFVREEEIDEE